MELRSPSLAVGVFVLAVSVTTTLGLLGCGGGAVQVAPPAPIFTSTPGNRSCWRDGAFGAKQRSRWGKPC
jgi:hypothetical protein